MGPRFYVFHMNPYHFENVKYGIFFILFFKKIARLMTGTKVGTVEDDEVTDNATMVRCNFQFHEKNEFVFYHEILKLIIIFFFMKFLL